MKSPVNLRYYAIMCVTLGCVGLLLQAGKKQPPTFKSGSKLYMASCEPCHQTGGNMIEPDKKIVDSKKLASKSTFRAFLSGQHAQMPPWKTIISNDSDLTQLYEYVRKLK